MGENMENICQKIPLEHFCTSVNITENDSMKIFQIGYGYCKNKSFRISPLNTLNFVHYVMSGSGYVNGIKISANQGFVIVPGKNYEYYPDEKDPWCYLWFVTSDFLFHKYNLYYKIDNKDIFRFDFIPQLEDICRRIYHMPNPIAQYNALSIFFDVLSLHILEKNMHKCQPLTHIYAAKNYIETNISKKIRVSDIASAIQINERYMYNIFLKFEQITPKEYIIQQKLLLACNLLTSTEHSVTEVSASIGFSDVYTFSHFFKKHTGLSPNQYRNAQQQNG